MGFETSESYENEDLWQPYPELVAPDLDKKKMYEIVNSSAMPGMPTNGMTDKVRQVLYVPLESSGRSVSLHELAHVRWSPKRLPKHLGAPLMIVRAIEDARINLGLSNLEMPLDFAADLCADVLSIARQDVVRGDVVALTLRAVASFGTNIEHRLEGLLAVASEPIFASIRAVVGEARDRLQRARLDDPVASFDQGLCTARWLAAELKKLGLPEPQEGGVLVGCCGGVRKHGRPARLDRRLAALLDGMEGSTHTQVRPGRRLGADRRERKHVPPLGRHRSHHRRGAGGDPRGDLFRPSRQRRAASGRPRRIQGRAGSPRTLRTGQHRRPARARVARQAASSARVDL